MDLLPQLLTPLAIIGVIAFSFARRNRERARNAPLRGEIEARVCFETSLDRASILGTGGFGGTRGYWIPVPGPKRLIVGTDAFLVCAPQALREFVFTGRESSFAFNRMRSRLVERDRDWIVITGQVNGRQVQLAIAQDNLLDVWQAPAGTGAALAGDEQPAVYLTRPRGRPVRSGRYSLRRLAAALVIVLIADAAAWIGAIVLPLLGDLGNIKRAGLPAQARANPATLPGIWWACLLAFFMLPTFVLPSGTGSPANPAWYAGKSRPGWRRAG